MGALIWNLLIGLVIGAIAKLVMPGTQGGGWFVTALLGVGGALVATFLGQAVGWYGPNQNAGLIASVIGALIVLFAYGKLRGNKSS
jgi:uncharacterized membrane protein YeaQ/YmgE (transglycosylase-associated protein family)